MKILLVHNAYQMHGGEDAVVADEHRLLLSHGHDVRLYQRHNDEINERPRWSSAVDAIWSRTSARDVEAILTDWRPDLLHLHNTFPLISPSVIWAAARQRTATVATLHNFRLACLEGTFMRDGALCQKCVGRFPAAGVINGCYRGSRAASAVLAASLTTHRFLSTWQRVHRFIALTASSIDLLVASGLPRENIRVKPNFAWPLASSPDDGSTRRGGLFVGRLTRQKGTALLAQALAGMTAPGFTVVGDGPDAGGLGGSGVSMAGTTDSAGVLAHMLRASYLVIPTISYEQYPRVLVEAYAAGLPVIAARRGALADLVRHGQTGLHFEAESATDLAAQLRWAEGHPQEMAAMGQRAREMFVAQFSPEHVYRQQIEIYEEALDAAADCARQPAGV